MSSYAAEFGTAAINVQAVTRSGSSGVPRQRLRLPAPLQASRPTTGARNYAGAGSARTRSSSTRASRSPVRSSSPAPASAKNRDKAFFFLGYEWQRQTRLAPDAIRGVVPTAGMRQGLFNDFGPAST